MRKESGSKWPRLQLKLSNHLEKKFNQMPTVADPANGNDFMAKVCFHANNSKIFVMYFFKNLVLIYEYLWMQINKHWTSNPKLELTLEKLQKIAITHVLGQFKARWFK